MSKPATPLALALLLSLGLWTGPAHGASLDCKRASTRIEHMICDDVADLPSLDSQLDGAYAGALDRSLHRDAVKARQLQWLKSRDACADARCLVELYRRRIEVLSHESDEPALCQDGATPAINACAKEHDRRAEAELTRYLAAAVKRLNAEIAEGGDTTTSRAALAGLEASQKAWQAYQKAECQAVYDWWSGGTIRGLMYSNCLQGLAEARSLWIWQTWLTYPDSTPPLMPKPGK